MTQERSFMKTAEKAGRFLIALVGILGALLLVIPHIGISVDTVMSGSMEPVLQTGGIVFTDTQRKIPEVGDIITYRVGESKITHRVIRKERQGYVTKGDANNMEDPSPVAETQIIGKVIFAVPFLGYAAVFIRQKTIFSILAVMVFQELVFLLMQWKGERCRKSAKHIYEK